MKKLYYLLFLFLFAGIETGQAQYTVLLNFNGASTPQGAAPYGSLIISGRTLYGMTQEGGPDPADLGNIFSVDTSGGSFKNLLDFNRTNGSRPDGTLLLSGKTLFGTAQTGGAYNDGCIFSIDTDGTNYRDLHDFAGYPSDGNEPSAALIMVGNVLYTMTYAGGAHNLGCIVAIDTDGSRYRDLFDFNGTDGAYPLYSTLTLSGGKFFGMTTRGGAHDSGCIFTMDTNGNNFKDVYSFTYSSGMWPDGSVTLLGTKLYGMCWEGGTHNDGTIFRLDSNGRGYTVLYNFNWPSGALPDGDLVLSGNQFYGLTSDGGSMSGGCIFSIDTNGNRYTDVFNYTPTNGEAPYGSPLISQGTIYGMTNIGGRGSAPGVVFKYIVLGAKPTILANVTCNGGNNGRAAVAAQRGVAPFTYSWSPNGGNKDTATGLSAGTYTITITDSTGMQASTTVTITQAPAISIATGMTPANCNTPNGTATATPSNGVIPYTYLWNPGGSTNATATGLTNGVYTITVTDHNGCIATATDTVLSTAENAVAVVINNVTCTGGSNGSIGARVSGGVTPYTYLWSPYGGTNDTAKNLSAGTYTITVLDNNGCISKSQTIITQPPALNLTATYQNITCNGFNNGSALGTISGGTSPYTYSWSGGRGTNSMASGLSVGSYTLTIHDSCGNSATASVSITQPTALNLAAHVTANVYCYGGTNGSASATVSGGTSPYTYLWTDGGGNTDTATGLAKGTYTLNVTDGNSCTASASVTITQPLQALSVSDSVTKNELCYQGTEGSIVSRVIGGTSPYTYLWSNNKTNTTISGLTAGTYTLNVTDSNGCTASALATVTQPTLLTIPISYISNVDCFEYNDGSASVSPSGGTGPYTYAWSNGESTATADTLTNTTFTLIVTDKHGCTASLSITITQPPPISVYTYSTPDSGSCKGCAWLKVSGGTPPYQYDWGNGNTTDSIYGQCNGLYCCNVIDAHACMQSPCVQIASSAGINNLLSDAEEITVYPNPSNGVFNLEITNYELGMNNTIEVYNILGERIYSQLNIQNSTFNINLNSQPNGVYLYRVITDSGGLVSEGKLLLQK